MPDSRKHRGPHPDDAALFGRAQRAVLVSAVGELSWLLTRGYADRSALALVGNRHGLTARQRAAVRRAACSEQALERRRSACRTPAACRGGRLGIDGFNVLITIESALSGGVVVVGRDGCYRDLASVHGTYRKVAETPRAVALMARWIIEIGVGEVDCYLDRPVSNSGRLKVLMAGIVEAEGGRWNIELVDNPDAVLARYRGTVATSDSWILDRCDAWVNLAADVMGGLWREAWVLDLRGSGASTGIG